MAATSGLPAVRSSAGSWHDGGVIPLKGKLLLATPPLADPNFDRTVVLMLEHGDEGALGLVLNRPTAEDIDELLPAWRPLVTGDPVLFDGGPVEHAAVIGLAWVRPDPYDLDDRSDEFDEEVVEEGLGTVDLSGDPFGLTDRVEQLRLFRGYAGWGPGQLDQELSQSAWLTCDVDLELVFDTEPARMWETAIRRLGADPSAFQMSHGVH